MTLFRRFASFAVILGVSITVCTGVYAQVSTINSIVIHPREFNDVPNSTLNIDTIYHPGLFPSFISFDDQGVSAPSGFANRSVWRFSNDNGTSALQFGNNDFFSVFMNVTLMGSPTSPRKEAGFLLDTIGGQGQFILNTDAHEVVAFGGPLPFYAFPATFNSGSTVTLGMTYGIDPATGLRAITYYANGISSGWHDFTNLEQGIIDHSTLGGYLQVVNNPSDPNNSGMAVFSNISITSVPEPSLLALAGLGALSLMLRRRRA